MVTLKIDGMTCASCAEHVRQALEKVPGVRSAAVSYSKALADVQVDGGVSHDTLAAAVTTAGYHAGVADVPTQSEGLLDRALGSAGLVGSIAAMPARCGSQSLAAVAPRWPPH